MATVGPIIISVNPAAAHETPNGNNDAVISDLAKQIIEKSKSSTQQVVQLCGETGAGKTVFANRLVSNLFLAQTETETETGAGFHHGFSTATAGQGNDDTERQQLVERFEKGNQVIELFGNARTRMNPNYSSRPGIINRLKRLNINSLLLVRVDLATSTGRDNITLDQSHPLGPIPTGMTIDIDAWEKSRRDENDTSRDEKKDDEKKENDGNNRPRDENETSRNEKKDEKEWLSTLSSLSTFFPNDTLTQVVKILHSVCLLNQLFDTVPTPIPTTAINPSTPIPTSTTTVTPTVGTDEKEKKPYQDIIEQTEEKKSHQDINDRKESEEISRTEREELITQVGKLLGWVRELTGNLYESLFQLVLARVNHCLSLVISRTNINYNPDRVQDKRKGVESKVLIYDSPGFELVDKMGLDQLLYNILGEAMVATGINTDTDTDRETEKKMKGSTEEMKNKNMSQAAHRFKPILHALTLSTSDPLSRSLTYHFEKVIKQPFPPSPIPRVNPFDSLYDELSGEDEMKIKEEIKIPELTESKDEDKDKLQLVVHHLVGHDVKYDATDMVVHNDPAVDEGVEEFVLSCETMIRLGERARSYSTSASNSIRIERGEAEGKGEGEGEDHEQEEEEYDDDDEEEEEEERSPTGSASSRLRALIAQYFIAHRGSEYA
ncbi:hypothetical protein TREMEDRAFT_66295 [Tremella mesenterica DSM 1558]|uniref:uncharacterized protein n=1 Tax=Tremella mesenterica (strain ATCC 24925 / CBS 8224 / DSM 1558 / NBRC 9311 / NRRL Y-6157 / RJB 2259-6 / UBC 559-6) TaxID=578456 RepID=UPI00032D28D7|nr:uncharacterized protein TREMEDRAFT_66295 [Tremella mesenterica DSM 1558]EIW65696.1 hypothetical protein TREMEDRAFT_66295 [Tremella mesenterica DSM 1558]